MTDHRRSTVHLAWVALWLACAPALAADASTAPTRPVVDVPNHVLCTHGPSHDGKPTCMSRADAMVEQSRQAVLDRDPTQYLRNASMRCDRLPEADRRDCQSRMKGRGTTTGSVEGGGIYRELVTREVLVGDVLVPLSAGPVAPTPGPQKPAAAVSR